MFDARPNLVANSETGWLSGTQYSGVPTSGGETTGWRNNLKGALNMEKFHELRQERLGNMRSWMGEFLNRQQFSVPDGYTMVQNRLSSNVRYFQSNYFVIVLILLVYCILQHFMLAVMIIFTTAAYLYVQSLPEDYALQLGGMVITKKTLYVTIGVVGIMVFLFTSVGSAFFWLVGITALIVGAHASFHEVSL